MKASKIYFPGLNALRFFAATLVIFHHLEQYKLWSEKPSLWGVHFIDALGHKPVAFFFVLSGFLITHILLEEQQKNNTIRVSRFYLKRIFRIWPLYAVVVFIALVLIPLFSDISFAHLPKPNQPEVVLSLLFMVPNLLRLSFPTLLGANQLWSIGIEEQFYLFWPFLIQWFRGNLIQFLCLFVLLKLTGQVVLWNMMLFSGTHINEVISLVKLEKLYTLYTLFPIEKMAIGGLGASLIFTKKYRFLSYMKSKWVGALASISLLLSSFFPIDFFLSPLLEAIAFMILIYQVITHRQIYKYLENRILSYLGSISYGIYMWHTIAITICVTLTDALGWGNYFVVCLMSLSLTLALFSLSYRYLEHPMLGLKNKFLFSHARS